MLIQQILHKFHNHFKQEQFWLFRAKLLYVKQAHKAQTVIICECKQAVH